ncbi:MAG: HAD hydrolase-like protein [Rickettsiales bacterium]|nr:HAD hydrolase-like protein [Rickettsiales bacterium]
MDSTIKQENKMNFEENRKALLNLSKPKAIIFDWDNTLVDTWPLIHYAIDRTMIAMNREPWGLEKVRDTIHKSMRESFPAIFGDDWQKAGEIYKNAYRSSNLEKLVFLPNAIELIDAIEEKGILQFVVSNKIGATLRKEAENLGIAQKFFALVGAGDAVADKPSRHPVEFALIGSDLDPKKDEIWFVGDTITDLECAYNSGCRPIILGFSENQVSKTIPHEALKGIDDKGFVPLYFDHSELIEVIKKF